MVYGSVQYKQRREVGAVNLWELESRAMLQKISLDYHWDSERKG